MLKVFCFMRSLVIPLFFVCMKRQRKVMVKNKLFQKILFVAIFIGCFGFVFANSQVEDAKDKRSSLVTYAKSYVGVPYVYGGLDRTGIDCSGLIYTVARDSIKLQLPRTVAALYGFVKIIPDNQKEAGDLVFFKTVGDKISHVGIYVGNNQFIHAASDGPNTGVILSSLNESYWKEHYFAVGQILPATIVVSQPSLAGNTTTSEGSPTNFLSSLKIDGTVFFDWNFFNANQILLNPRGFEIQGNVSYKKNQLQPGIGGALKFDPKTKIFQIPLVFSLGVSDNFRFYAGPVFSLGKATLPGKSEVIKPSVFPGILGVSWQTNDFKIRGYGISFAQDISYSVYNAESGAALSFVKSIVSGLVFSSGIRVTFPQL